MAKFLSETGLTTLWGRIDSLFVRKSAVSSAGATIGTSDTTIATIGGVDIKAKIGTYLTSSNLTNHAKLADTSTAGQALVSKSGGYEWKTLGSNAYNSTAFLTAHQTIKQNGITGATRNCYGTCSTAAATAAKTVSVTSGTPTLEAGLRVTVKFTNKNTASTPTLNVNSLGAKNIFHNGAQITTSSDKYGLLAGTVDFVYDGTQWQLVGNYYNSNTDTKVTQTVTTSSNTDPRPLLLGYSYSTAATFSPSTVTNTSYASHLAKFAPSTGVLSIVGLSKMTTSGTMDTTGWSLESNGTVKVTRIEPKTGDVFTIGRPNSQTNSYAYVVGNVYGSGDDISSPNHTSGTTWSIDSFDGIGYFGSLRVDSGITTPTLNLVTGGYDGWSNNALTNSISINANTLQNLAFPDAFGHCDTATADTAKIVTVVSGRTITSTSDYGGINNFGYSAIVYHKYSNSRTDIGMTFASGVVPVSVASGDTTWAAGDIILWAYVNSAWHKVKVLGNGASTLRRLTHEACLSQSFAGITSTGAEGPTVIGREVSQDYENDEDVVIIRGYAIKGEEYGGGGNQWAILNESSDLRINSIHNTDGGTTGTSIFLGRQAKWNYKDVYMPDFFGYSDTVAGTVAKTTSGNTKSLSASDLKDGICAVIYHKYANSATNPTLNVGGSGAKPMYSTTQQRITGSNAWTAGDIILWVYDKSYSNNTGAWFKYQVLGNGASNQLNLLTGALAPEPTAITNGEIDTILAS